MKFTKKNKNRVILVCLALYLMIIVEIVLYLLLCQVYSAIGLIDFIAWEIVMASLFIFLLLALWNSRRVRFMFSFFLMLISASCFFFLILIQTYNLIELALTGILGALLVVSLIVIIRTHNQHLERFILFIVLGIGGFFIFIYIYFQKPFFSTLIELIIIFPLSLSCFLYSMQTYQERSQPIIHFGGYLKLAFLLIPIISASFLLFPIKYITIDPKTSPEIIFWADSSSLPDDDATLDLCAENDIGFAVVLRDYGRYLDNDAKESIEMLLNHSVITYIAIGGKDGEFYCTIDNADTFEAIFINIRDWLVLNGLYEYPNLRGFMLDCETPAEMIEDFGGYSFLEKCEYLVGNIPSQKALLSVKKDLDSLIDMIHKDEKDIGIIKLPSFYDNFDDDSDYALLTRNIYPICKELDWDFSVSMNYRTKHIPRFHDYLISDMNQYDYTQDYELEYLEEDDLERSLVPLSTFYYEVVFELNSEEFGIEPEDRYIFIGNFNPKFQDTSYIKDKEYKKDLDVCRHFGCDKVFFYEWRTFKKCYGSDELEDLIKHNEDLHDDWILTTSALSINRELFLTLAVGVADRLVFIY